MRSGLGSWLGLLPLVACGGPAGSVVERAAIARYGSIERAPTSVEATTTGTVLGLPCRETVRYRAPLSYAVETEIVGIGTQTRVFDGERGFLVGDGGLVELDPTDTRALQSESFDAAAFWLTALLTEPNLIVGPAVPGRFRDLDVLTVEVTHRRGYLRDLHFDPDTFHLLGMEGMADTAQGRQYVIFEFSAPRAYGDVTLPSRYRQTARDTGLVLREGEFEAVTLHGGTRVEARGLRAAIPASGSEPTWSAGPAPTLP